MSSLLLYIDTNSIDFREKYYLWFFYYVVRIIFFSHQLGVEEEIRGDGIDNNLDAQII